MTIKEIRALTGLSQVKFCEKYHIPLNTFARWEQGKREPPDYLVELLEFKVREDYKVEKLIPMEMVDEMSSLKNALKSVSAKNAEDMLKNLTAEEKDCLLRLYVYEGKNFIAKIEEIKQEVQSLKRLMPSKEYIERMNNK